MNFSEYISYDPESGSFAWIVRRGGVRAGAPAGTIDRFGYQVITIGRRRYPAHRIAWTMYYGEMPPSQVDHINLDKSDNRIANLRLATPSENQMNTRGRGAHLKGVTLHKSGKYQAQIKRDGRGVYLGLFDREEDAAAAYARASRVLFGEFGRTA